MDMRLAHLLSLAQLQLFAIQNLASFSPKIEQISSLNKMENILETAITMKQDLFTNLYKNNNKLGKLYKFWKMSSIQKLVV